MRLKARSTLCGKTDSHANAATDADFADLKKHFSDEEIVDLHMLIGLANLTNRVTGPLALEIEFPEEKL